MAAYAASTNYGFVRLACSSPDLIVADCLGNAARIIADIKSAAAAEASLIVFPELSITAYTCNDLFLQQRLLREAVTALELIADSTREFNLITVVGLPIALGSALFNCAALLHGGNVIALIPKTFIPNYSEFYERRHFAPAPPGGTTAGVSDGAVRLSDRFPSVPFGTDILLVSDANPDFVLAAEICEDFWVPNPPSITHALSGATGIVNLSASNEIIGKAGYRRMLVASQSGRAVAAYVYADAGAGESTQDLVFAGHNLIAENGSILSESRLFSRGLIQADVDLERLLHERRRTTTFEQCSQTVAVGRYRRLPVALRRSALSLTRPVDPHPFVPSGTAARAERCAAVIELQAQGLAKRLQHTRARAAVIGLSGGLDSTLALLVTVRAFAICGREVSGILSVTMPCFGTSGRTRGNAEVLARALGTDFREIRIEAAVRQHFADIGQDEATRDVTYENCQARERTQVLMDLANKTGGIVIGTGDLSELALGWATYNGDHMSMYGVNATIPKTLVRYLVAWEADEAEAAGKQATADVLRDILDTPVSPELLPPESDGRIAQRTEDVVGPYELHDFFLYYLMRWAFAPAKIFFLAKQAFGEAYPAAVILKWLRVFCRRFFQQQFKRSCLPDGAKVGTVCLSPRGDWRMPSDASVAAWERELSELDEKDSA
jgi:NAD+ synthase (glutamine-hydrolysing)